MTDPPAAEHTSGQAPLQPPAEPHEPSPDRDDNIWARLRRAMLGSKPRRIVAVVALLVVVIAAAGIVEALKSARKPSSSATNLSGSTTSEAGEAASPEANCTTGPVEHNMRVTVYGASAEVCTNLNREAGHAGEYWRIVPTGNRVEGSQLVCSMVKGNEFIEVRDTGEHAYGNRVCAGLTAEGWVEKEGPGEKAEREQKEAEEQAAARRVEEERPEHEAAAARLSEEAAALYKKQQHEKTLAKIDEAEAEHIEAVASRVEEEEPAEGGAGKDEEAAKIRDEADRSREHADTHEENATNFMGEAESKEREAKEEREKE